MLVVSIHTHKAPPPLHLQGKCFAITFFIHTPATTTTALAASKEIIFFCGLVLIVDWCYLSKWVHVYIIYNWITVIHQTEWIRRMGLLLSSMHCIVLCSVNERGDRWRGVVCVCVCWWICILYLCVLLLFHIDFHRKCHLFALIIVDIEMNCSSSSICQLHTQHTHGEIAPFEKQST